MDTILLQKQAVCEKAGVIMSEGYYSAVMLGTVVEADIAEKFRKAVEPHSTEEAIKAFIYTMIEGGLKLAPYQKGE